MEVRAYSRNAGLFLHGHSTEDTEFEYEEFRSQWFKDTKANRKKFAAYTNENCSFRYDGKPDGKRVKIRRKGRFIRLHVITIYDL